MANAFAVELRKEATMCVLAPDGRVYKIKRIRAANLADQKVAELLGQQDAVEALISFQREQKAEADAFKKENMTKAARKKWEAKQKEREEHNKAAAAAVAMRNITKSPQRLQALLERADAYCCAGVVGGSFVVPESFEVGAEVPEDQCDVIPFRLVLNEADADPDADLIWVGMLDEETRQVLCGRVSELSAAPRVRPFRGET